MTKGWSLFKYIRVFILLFILFIVAMDSWLARIRSTDWNNTLNVVVVPINPEKNQAVDNYISGLEEEELNIIEDFFDREAQKYISMDMPAFNFILGDQLHQTPPELDASGEWYQVALWSLKTRYWVYKTRKSYKNLYPDIMLFMNYYDPAIHHSVRHSLGLEKGLYGIVYGFGSEDNKRGNHVVIAHELLHTLGASDKYQVNNNQPLFPIGYADREKRPMLPQSKAELMAGRIPLTDKEAVMPNSLREVVIGPETALEINWLQSL